MKKNIIKSGFILAVFALGLTFSNNANAEEGCYTVTITCSDGTGSLALICGSSSDELFDEFVDMADAVCN